MKKKKKKCMGKKRKFVWAHLAEVRTQREREREGQPNHPSFLDSSLSSFYTLISFVHDSWHIYSHAHLTHINKRFVAVFKCSIPSTSTGGMQGMLGHPSGCLYLCLSSLSHGQREKSHFSSLTACTLVKLISVQWVSKSSRLRERATCTLLQVTHTHSKVSQVKTRSGA